MADALTVDAGFGRRFLSFIAGAGMIAASFLTIQHFYAANFPESIYKGSFCDISAFFNCNSSAFSKIAHYQGVPLGWPGLFLGVLVVLGAFFPSRAFEKTNKALSLLNALGVVGLFVYSVVFLKSLCLLCTGYYIFSLFSFFLFWKYGIKGFPFPSLKQLIVYAAIFLAGAYGFHLFYRAKQEAQLGGVAARVVKEYYSLEKVPNPSFISPFWTAQATERFDDAPIRVIEYADFRCPDCLFMYELLNRLKAEFAGKVNIAFQFFPLEAKCNTVVGEGPPSRRLRFVLYRGLRPVEIRRDPRRYFRPFPGGPGSAMACGLGQKIRRRGGLDRSGASKTWSSGSSIPARNTIRPRSNTPTASARRRRSSSTTG